MSRRSFQNTRSFHSFQDPRDLHDTRNSTNLKKLREMRHRVYNVECMGSADSSAESIPASRGDVSAVWASAMGTDLGSLPLSKEHGDQGFDEMQSTTRSLRLDVLAGFESFIQGLDNQPQAYGLDEFIQGAADAFKVGSTCWGQKYWGYSVLHSACKNIGGYSACKKRVTIVQWMFSACMPFSPGYISRRASRELLPH